MPKKLIILILFVSLLNVGGCNTSYFRPESKTTGDTPADAPTAVFQGAVSQGANLQANVPTSFNSSVRLPQVSSSAYVHPGAAVIGHVQIGDNVLIGPFASVRGDEGGPIYVGSGCNIQDGVVIHALETEKDGKPVKENLVEKDGKAFAVYIGKDVSLAHQAQVHGPALIEDNVFIGMQAFVFKSRVGSGSVLEPGARVIGVTIPPGRYVPAGQVVTTQAEADKLPPVTAGYSFYGINAKVLEVNRELTAGYKQLSE